MALQEALMWSWLTVSHRLLLSYASCSVAVVRWWIVLLCVRDKMSRGGGRAYMCGGEGRRASGSPVDDDIDGTCRPGEINGVFGLSNEVIYFLLTPHIFIWFVE
jgi:hypothetical protein